MIKSGLFSTIQDQGRYGYAPLGRTTSGAMDEYAYLWGQKLLNNHYANAIEVMVGLELEATKPTTISVTGADLNFCLNAQPMPIWQTFNIKKGDRLSFPKRVSGQRAYLAVKDGFTIKKEYGSYATTLKEKLGSKLQKGELLPFHASTSQELKRLKPAFIPRYTHHLTLHLLLTYQNDSFSEEEQKKFFNSNYQITLQSDRMGAKLQGEAITPKITGIISEGIAFGAVQIPKDGQPILLLKERQTIGGYPKIGTVLASDCFKFSQLSVGDTINFKAIGLEEMREKMLTFYKYL